ncbi:MAG: DEAD/DEAH box helicase family protein [Candidatus Microthrix sp.]|nr:DEAD/DEAH box helicase family protein [Candidatus Microthrix sp.]
MATRIRLRPWQHQALEKFNASERDDFLAVATPGAGKTTFALTAASQYLAGTRGRRLIIVAPTQHLKTQWSDAAARFGLHLDPAWSAREGTLPGDVHGIVTTYQQVATSSVELSGWPPGHSSSSTRCTTPAMIGPGARRSWLRLPTPDVGCRCRVRRSDPMSPRFRSSPTTSTRPNPTSSMATATPWPTAAWCGRCSSRASVGLWSG